MKQEDKKQELRDAAKIPIFADRTWPVRERLALILKSPDPMTTSP